MADNSPKKEAAKERPRHDLTSIEETVVSPKAKVVFYDDDHTPVDFVLHLLEAYLGFDEPKARKAVQAIRVAGRCIVGEMLPAVARNTVKRMAEAAEKKGYTFRMEVVEGEKAP